MISHLSKNSILLGVCHGWFHLYRLSQAVRNMKQATITKWKKILSTVGFDPTTFHWLARHDSYCSTDPKWMNTVTGNSWKMKSACFVFTQQHLLQYLRIMRKFDMHTHYFLVLKGNNRNDWAFFCIRLSENGPISLMINYAISKNY